MSEHEDNLARLRAMTDQAKAGTGDFADVIAAFYVRLVRRGVPSDHALQLTTTMLVQITGGFNR